MKDLSITNNTEMKNSKEQKMLGVIIDKKLKLRKKSYVKNLSYRAPQKIQALSPFINYLNDSEEKMTYNALIKSVQLLSISMDVLFQTKRQLARYMKEP